MSDTDLDKLSDHEYDGIREYDNPLPGWWVWVFWVTVVFSVGYFLWYHVGIHGRGVNDSYAVAAQEIEARRAAASGELRPNTATMLMLMNDPKAMERGATVYKMACGACHGFEGQGLVGPNLTDDYYKNVKTLGDVVAVVLNGAGNGTMPARGGQPLPDADVYNVSAYVAALRGKNLPTPPTVMIKGDLIEAWPTAGK
jgi:cytochrome c oxidase cbb3-type subunit 3